MSVAGIGDSLPSTIPTNALEVSIPCETTYRKACELSSLTGQEVSLAALALIVGLMPLILFYTCRASKKAVHIYSFNIPSEDLKAAYALLDKEPQRRSMRLTYSDGCNFIIRHKPGKIHVVAVVYFDIYTATALATLRTPPFPYHGGCHFLGGTTFEIQVGDSRRKEADACIRPEQSCYPSVILEVGSSESLSQVEVDAQLWIEHVPEVKVAILVLIDPPIAPNPNPRITVQLWRGRAPAHPPPSQSAAAQHTREAYMAWRTDWTDAATPMYLLLSDIFMDQASVPAYYGNNTQAVLDTISWRQAIIDIQLQ